MIGHRLMEAVLQRVAERRCPGVRLGGPRPRRPGGVFHRANAEHESHFVDASDALCKSQLKERSNGLPAGTPWTTDAEFEAINVYFQPPAQDERFNVVRHERT
jgi:hypothetical protein